MSDHEKDYFEKILDILEPMGQERHISILIEINGVIQKIITQRLRVHQEIKEIFNFLERIKMIKEIDFRQATIYIHGNYHIFTLINFLINKNPKTIVYKKNIEELGISTIGLSNIYRRAAERGVGIKEV